MLDLLLHRDPEALDHERVLRLPGLYDRRWCTRVRRREAQGEVPDIASRSEETPGYVASEQSRRRTRPGSRGRAFTSEVGGASRTRRFRGRRRRLAVVLVLVALGGVFESVPGAPGHDAAALAARLVASDAGVAASKADPFASTPRDPCAALESSFGVGNGLLRDDWFGFYASIWPSYQALNAFFVTSLLPHNGQCARDYAETLSAIDSSYWSHSVPGMPPAYDQGPAAMHFPSDLPRVDDSLWMGITLMQSYRRTRHEAYLMRAEAVFDLARANWDPRHGGIYWEDHGPGATDFAKSVVSNAPAAVIALDAYQATGRRSYLAWAERIVAWLHSHLLDPADGLYYDHVDNHHRPPVLDRATYTYNQGIMVGCLGLLSEVSPHRYPLSEAISLAQRAMRYFATHHSYKNPAFSVVWGMNLLWVAGLYHHAGFTAEARASVAAAIRAEPNQPGSLLDSASATALRSLSKLPPRDYGELAP